MRSMYVIVLQQLLVDWWLTPVCEDHVWTNRRQTRSGKVEILFLKNHTLFTHIMRITVACFVFFFAVLVFCLFVFCPFQSSILRGTFNLTSCVCVFYRQHMTSCIKTIYHHKSLGILLIAYFTGSFVQP